MRVVGIVASLRSCALFTGLPAEDLETIAAFSISKHLSKGEYLFHEGGPSEGFYIVRSGAINVHRLGASGKEQVIHLFRPGESFAEATLATETGYPADSRAVEASNVILVPKREILNLLKLRPDLSLRMLASMSQHLRVLVGALDDLTLKDVETRLANWLIKRCPRPISNQPTHIELETSKAVLAAELSTRAETLSRTFAKYRDLKLIKIRGKSIEVLKPKELEKILRSHLGEV